MATLKCQYCGSPIPPGADQCRSCQMSGEIRQPGDVHTEKVKAAESTRRLIVMMAVVALVATVGVLFFLSRR
jgi:hypothetical protein